GGRRALGGGFGGWGRGGGRLAFGGGFGGGGGFERLPGWRRRTGRRQLSGFGTRARGRRFGDDFCARACRENHRGQERQGQQLQIHGATGDDPCRPILGYPGHLSG